MSGRFEKAVIGFCIFYLMCLVLMKMVSVVIEANGSDIASTPCGCYRKDSVS
jgi:hypothetical protein